MDNYISFHHKIINFLAFYLTAFLGFLNSLIWFELNYISSSFTLSFFSIIGSINERNLREKKKSARTYVFSPPPLVVVIFYLGL